MSKESPNITPASVALQIAFEVAKGTEFDLPQGLSSEDVIRRRARFIGIVAGDIIDGMRERLSGGKIDYQKDPGEGGGCIRTCYTGGCTRKPGDK